MKICIAVERSWRGVAEWGWLGSARSCPVASPACPGWAKHPPWDGAGVWYPARGGQHS